MDILSAVKSIEVVAAVIRQGDRLFATERGYGPWKDWWEFPGGKMEAGESPEEALKREIREELDTEIGIGRLLKTVDWDYPDFHLTLHCFICTLQGEAPHLNEHEAARWLDYTQLREVRWLPADEQLLPLLAAELLGVDPLLAGFIEGEIIPRYAAFDKAHREDHARSVVQRAMQMSAYYPEVRRDVLYAAAACHDLGLAIDRKTHHLESGRMIRAAGPAAEAFDGGDRPHRGGCGRPPRLVGPCAPQPLRPAGRGGRPPHRPGADYPAHRAVRPGALPGAGERGPLAAHGGASP